MKYLVVSSWSLWSKTTKNKEVSRNAISINITKSVSMNLSVCKNTENLFSVCRMLVNQTPHTGPAHSREQWYGFLLWEKWDRYRPWSNACFYSDILCLFFPFSFSRFSSFHLSTFNAPDLPVLVTWSSHKLTHLFSNIWLSSPSYISQSTRTLERRNDITMYCDVACSPSLWSPVQC